MFTNGENVTDNITPSQRVLVTGGAGFIGSNLVHHLLEHTTDHVLNFDALTYAGNLDSLRDLDGHPRYSFVQGDVRNQQMLYQTIESWQPDSIIHLAAESHVDRSIDGPRRFLESNVVGTYCLLEAARSYWQSLPAARQNRFRLLHVSTDEVFGSLSKDDAAFDESSPYNPRSPYAASKAGADHLVRAWHITYGLPVLITNCSNNYGPYQFPEKLIPVVIHHGLHGSPIPVYGQGENIRDWLYVADHVAALLTVIKQGTIGETYHIGGHAERSNIELVRTICHILDELAPIQHNQRFSSTDRLISSYDQLIQFVVDRPGHDLRYGMNTEKISTDLGWSPSVSLESGLRKTVQWYLDHHEWVAGCLAGDGQLPRLGLGATHAIDREPNKTKRGRSQ